MTKPKYIRKKLGVRQELGLDLSEFKMEAKELQLEKLESCLESAKDPASIKILRNGIKQLKFSMKKLKGKEDGCKKRN